MYNKGNLLSFVLLNNGYITTPTALINIINILEILNVKDNFPNVSIFHCFSTKKRTIPIMNIPA